MSSVVADTTPLNYLVLIEAVEILSRLYNKVLIPPSVMLELADSHAPGEVRAWITHSPAWLHVVPLRGPADSSLGRLDAGERDAIALAMEQRASLLVMDERDGAAAARALNLRVVGTLAILDSAAERGWVDLSAVFERLHRTTFRSPRRLMAAMLEQDARREKKFPKD
jgi:predicted nucleic acid-binding protein